MSYSREPQDSKKVFLTLLIELSRDHLEHSRMNSIKVKPSKKELSFNLSQQLWVDKRNSTTDGSISLKRANYWTNAVWFLMSLPHWTSLSSLLVTLPSWTTRITLLKKKPCLLCSRTWVETLDNVLRNGDRSTRLNPLKKRWTTNKKKDA